MKKLITIALLTLSLTAMAQKAECYTTVAKVSHIVNKKAFLYVSKDISFITKLGDLQHGKDYIIYFTILKDDTPPVIDIKRKIITKTQQQKDMNFEAEQIRKEYNVIKYKKL